MNYDEMFLRINGTAQDQYSQESTVAWWRGKPDEDRQRALTFLKLCLHQSRPSPEEIQQGITSSGLKPTLTPCVVMTKNGFNEALFKLKGLPAHEQEKTFRLLLAIFVISDTRRRETQCKDGCTHDWHNL